jgi:hypothetical protein
VKLLIGNGAMVEVRNVGPVVMTLRSRPGGPPVKLHGAEVLEDDAARARLRDLLATGWYDSEKR